MKKNKPKKGMALLLVMAVIVVVLTTVSIAATVLLNNLDSSKGQEDTKIASTSAQAAIERVRGYYKNDNTFFDGCSVNECINFESNKCDSCDIPEATYINGDQKYKVMVTNKNITGVSLQATGYQGLYTQSINDGIRFTIFTCGDAVNGIIEDIEGNIYPTVEINGQCWMAQSLNSKVKLDGTCINGGGEPPCPPASKDDNGFGRSCFDNDENFCSESGALYTWEAAMDGDPSEGAQGLCPEGWHVPADTEWVDLENNLLDDKEDCASDRSEANPNEYQCASVGLALSSADNGGTTGFEGTPTGYRDEDQETFLDGKRYSKYWSSTGSKPNVIRSIDTDNLPLFGRNELDSSLHSFALRCIKDL